MTSTSKDRAKEKARAKLKEAKVNVAQLDKLLNIQKTPDPPRKAWYRTHGKRTGLGIMAFWATLFEGNELLPKSKKMTNAEIERQVRSEFPHEQTLLENLDSGRQSVNYYRHLYNKGRMSKPKGTPPQHISFRYNEEGLVIDTRTGKRMLDEVEVVEYAKRYQG
jgi:hypothetical protein|tara:strand:- start:212 stop:703 length:492 start_codon:yes stop_codon:yes gene_type:complete